MTLILNPMTAFSRGNRLVNAC